MRTKARAPFSVRMRDPTPMPDDRLSEVSGHAPARKPNPYRPTTNEANTPVGGPYDTASLPLFLPQRGTRSQSSALQTCQRTTRQRDSHAARRHISHLSPRRSRSETARCGTRRSSVRKPVRWQLTSGPEWPHPRSAGTQLIVVPAVLFFRTCSRSFHWHAIPQSSYDLPT